MKILVVSQFYYPEQFRVNDICKELVNMKHDVTVLTGLPNYPSGIIPKEYKWGKRRKEEIDGTKVIRSWLIPRSSGKIKLSLNYLTFAVSSSLKALFMKKDYDVVLCFQTSPVTMALPAIIMKKRTKMPFILYCQDQWPASLVAMNILENSIIYKILTPISRWIYKQADCLLVSSRMFEEYFDRVHGIHKNITYMPIYSESLFETVPETQKQPNIFNFVFAGNIGQVQSVDTIVRAAKILENNGQIFFHIVGDGSALNSVRELATELQLNNVIFYGSRPLETMPEFYAMADAMLVTLRSDFDITNTLPGKVQTCMAAGKPIIASIGGETKLVIDEANCGLCCDALDYEGLADLILKFVNEPFLIEQYADNSKKYYSEKFSKDIFFNSLNDIINDFVKRGKSKK